MIENIIEINKGELLSKISEMHVQGQRLITLSCAEDDDGFMVLYHFDNDLKMTHFRVKIGRDEPLESISHIYWAALLIENEISEHFGIKVNNLALNFAGTLVLAKDSPKAPLLKKK